MVKKASFFLLFLIGVQFFAKGQIVPSWRLSNWHSAGNTYNFNLVTDSVNVMNYGAFADGSTNDFQAIMDAINSFNGGAGMVYFPSGTYLINSPLILPDSIILKGNDALNTILKFNTGENQHCINISGSPSGGYIDVLEGFSKQSLHLTLADSGIFSKGDMAELLQNGNLHMTSSWAMNCLGQMVKIDSVSGYDIFLSSPLRMDYQALLSPRIRKINPVKGVSVQCLKIENLSPTTSQTSNIFFNYAQDCLIKGIESHNCNFAHIEINKSTNISVNSAYIHHGHSYGNGGKAYGVCIHATSGECLVENNIFQQLRHAMLLQSGANGNVYAYNYSKDPYWTDVSLPANSAGDMVLHGNYPYANLFEGNICQHIVIDDSHGKNGVFNTFLRNRAELYGIFMNNAPATDSVNFVGNEVTNTNFLMGLYMLNGNGHFQHGNNIKGTITPSGTQVLNDTSYHYLNKPWYWLPQLNFPIIGTPVPYNSLINPAKTRYLSGVNLASCNDTTIITEIYTALPNKKELRIINCTFNKLTNAFELEFECVSQNLINITVFNSIGALLYNKQVYPSSRIQKEFISCTSYKANAIYFIKLEQDGEVAVLKVLKY